MAGLLFWCKILDHMRQVLNPLRHPDFTYLRILIDGI